MCPCKHGYWLFLVWLWQDFFSHQFCSLASPPFLWPLSLWPLSWPSWTISSKSAWMPSSLSHSGGDLCHLKPKTLVRAWVVCVVVLTFVWREVEGTLCQQCFEVPLATKLCNEEIYLETFVLKPLLWQTYVLALIVWLISIQNYAFNLFVFGRSFRNLVWDFGGYWHLVSHQQCLCHCHHLRFHPQTGLRLQIRTLCWPGPCWGEVRGNEDMKCYVMLHYAVCRTTLCHEMFCNASSC